MASAFRWTSANGITLVDHVPAEKRRAWTAAGRCPGRDLYALFSDHVRAVPGRAAVVDDAGVLTCAALDDRVRRAAAALRAAGRGPADIIAVLLPNGRDAVVAEPAIAALGAVALRSPTRTDRATSHASSAAPAPPPSSPPRRGSRQRRAWTTFSCGRPARPRTTQSAPSAKAIRGPGVASPSTRMPRPAS